MSSLIGQLRVVLGMETASLESGAKRARHEIGAIGEAAREVRGLISGMFAAFAIEAMGEMVKRSIEHVAALGEQAKALGITTRELQEYRFVAGQAGMTIEQTDKFLGKLSKSMGDARNGAEAQRKAFGALSKVLGTDILKSAKGVGDAIPMISDALNKIEDPTRRNSIAAALLGRSWRDAGALLAMGSEGIDRLRKSAEELGIVLSDQQIQNAEETAHKLKALHDVLGARIDGAVAANAKAIYSLADSLLRLAGSLVTFWSKHPAQAAALLGAMVGGRMGGLPGAAAGALLGAAVETGTSRPASAFAEVANVNIANMRRIAREHGYKGDGSQSDHQIIQGLQRNPLFKGAASQARTAISRMHAAEARSGDFAMPAEGPGGTETPPEFLKGAGRKHGSDHAEQRAKEAEKLQYDLDRQSLEEKQQLLEAQRSMTTDTEDRNNLGLQLLQVEHDQKALEIDHNLKMVEIDKTISAAQKEAARQEAAKGKLLNDRLLLLRTEGANLQAELARQHEAEQTNNLAVQIKADRLRIEEDLAQTSEKRRKIELELLDLAYRQRERELQHIINDQYQGKFTHNADDRARAQLDLSALYGNKALAERQVRQSTAGPLEQLMRGIPDTADKMNEALENVAARGLSDLNDGLAEASASWIKMGGVAGNILRQLYTDLMKLLMAKYLERPAAGLLGKLFNAGMQVASSAGGVSKAANSDGLGDLKGFATGGSFRIGGMAGIDRNLLSINGAPAARVGRDEIVSISPANDRGRGAAYFDLRGAVVTQDILDQINAMGNAATVHGAMLGSSGAISTLSRKRARALPTGRR